MDTDSITDTESLPRIMGNTEEGELSDIEQDVSLTDADQALSEEQSDLFLPTSFLLTQQLNPQPPRLV